MRFTSKRLLTLIAIFFIAVFSGCCKTQYVQHEKISTVASADGSPISYGIKGEGEITLVFIHCWTCNHEFWRPQIEHFASQYRVVWLDLAGHGISGSQRNDYTMEAFGKDVTAVVKKIGAKNVVLIGHSMGGPVAIETAKILGSDVIGIVGVDTFHTPFEYPKSESEINAFIQPFKDDYKTASEQLVRSMFTPTADQELVTSIVNQMSVPSSELGTSALQEIFRWSARNGRSSLDSYASRLRNINAAQTDDAKALHESVTPIPDTGHFVAQVKPTEFNAALSEILTEFQPL